MVFVQHNANNSTDKGARLVSAGRYIEQLTSDDLEQSAVHAPG